MDKATHIVNDYKIQYIIEYDDPVPVNDFTNALNGFAKEYQQFISVKYGAEAPINAKLYIQEIKKGSIATTLVEYSELIIPFLGEINTIVEFGKFLKQSYHYLLGKKDNKDYNLDDLSIQDLNNLDKIIAPGAHDGRSIYINVIGDKNNIALEVGKFNAVESKAIKQEISQQKRELKEQITNIHYKQPIIITSVKSDLDATKGNKAIAKDIHPNELNVIWENDEEKAVMLKSNFNPLKMIFIVDLELQKVNDDIKLFRIIKLHDLFEQ